MPPIFIGGNSMVAWGRINGQVIEGVTTTLPACATRMFATDIFDWQVAGDEGLVYLDDVNSDPTIDEASLRYGKITGGLLPSPGTVVQSRSGLAFSAMLPSLDAVVYTISTHTSADGLYVNATLPFTVTTPTSTDGGTTTTPDAGNPARPTRARTPACPRRSRAARPTAFPAVDTGDDGPSGWATRRGMSRLRF